MLGPSHRPENAHTLCFGDHVCDRFDRLLGEARELRRRFEGERRQALSVFFEAIYPLVEELRVCETIVQEIARDCIYPDEIGCRLRMQEEVCASCHFILTQIRDNELLPVQFVRTLHPSCDDRVTLRRSPQCGTNPGSPATGSSGNNCRRCSCQSRPAPTFA